MQASPFFFAQETHMAVSIKLNVFQHHLQNHRPLKPKSAPESALSFDIISELKEFSGSFQAN